MLGGYQFTAKNLIAECRAIGEEFTGPQALIYYCPEARCGKSEWL